MHLLDSIIAFAAVVLVASLIVTAGTQLIISFLGLRGANLRRSLADLFENACDDKDAKRYGKVIARRVLRHPLLSGSLFSRFGIRIDELPFVPADAAGKLRWAGSGIPFQPWLLGALSGFFLWPASLAIINHLTSLDVSAFSRIVTQYAPFLNFVEHPWRAGAVAGALLGGLISRWRLATSVRADELVAVLEKLSSPPGGSLPDPAQRAMLVIAGEAQSGPRVKSNSTAAEYEKFVRELPENDEDGMAVAGDTGKKQFPVEIEQRLEGVNSWLDHVMYRASQRFTLQARVITVALSLVLVFGAHFDAIRIFRALSSDVQVRTQLAASADAITKQAGQFSRGRDEGAGREGVPDIYRKAMVDVLQSAPINAEQTKSKSRHSSRHSAAPAAATSQVGAAGSPTESSDGVQAAAQVSIQSGADEAQVPPSAQASPDAPIKAAKHRSSKSAKAKPQAIEVEKAAATPAEDRATMEAKTLASKALVTTPGFASREDAVAWLRATLDSDPATENLVANYEQTVNAQLVSDADKLLDHSASMQHDLARAELQLVPEKWLGWKPAGNELPGLLVALALLSLGAPICYNLLKTVASLRPLALTGTSYYPDRRIRREDRRQPQIREQAKTQTKAQLKVPEKKDEEQKPVAVGKIDSLL
jgi:hypothetical protein